jgi:tetratricopeptide (TPR) repeat protein
MWVILATMSSITGVGDVGVLAGIDPERLPGLAMSAPADARLLADRVLESSAPATDRTFALQAVSIVEREAGRTSQAISAIRRAIALSRAAEADARTSELESSLGALLAMAGRRRSAVEAFERALGCGDAVERPRILVRRSAAMGILDDHDASLRDATAALEELRRVGDATWEVRARSNIAAALVKLGRFGEAESQYARAQALSENQGADYDATLILLGRADCAHRMGDLPRALRMFYEARERFGQLGVVPPELLRDLAVVQLAAGLTEDAAATADDLVTRLSTDRDSALRRADGFVVAAIAHLAAGDPERAIDLARRAARSSHRQGHVGAERHARIVMLRAQYASGAISKRHARSAAELAAELKDRYSAERLDALVLAGRMSIDTGLADLAEHHLGAAAAMRHRGSALRRATAWYAKALLANARGERGAMLRACERGLDVLATHALSLGATELRARATVHGTDLAVLAILQVAVDGSARELIRWTERWRSTLHALPRAAVESDAVLAAELGRLRTVERELGAAPDPKQEAERRRIEDRIRTHVHTKAGDDTMHPRRFDAGALLDTLGDTTLVSVVGIKGGRFQAVVARDGRFRRVEAGRVAGIHDEIEFARFALRGAALAPEAAAAALLRSAEPGLAGIERQVLGPAVRLLGDGPVVLVPPSTLHAAPWGALPSLRDRAVTVAPSAAAWMHGRRADPPESGRTALVAGSGLASGGAEVQALVESYPAATVLTGAAATTSAVLDAIDGAWLAHVGAHGRYRGDNPMFSSLELADGPVTIYDFEGLTRAPYRLLLTACESGVGSPTGADELLGLSTSLSALGTVGLLASIVPVSLTVHGRLRAGDDLGRALLAARTAASTPVETASAWAFLALGAA